MFELVSNEREAVEKAAAQVHGSPYGPAGRAFLASAADAYSAMPERLRARLARFRATLGSAGSLVILGLPDVPALPRTPTKPFSQAIGRCLGTEAVHALVAVGLGQPIGFTDWHGGAVLQNLYPVPELAGIQCASNAVYLEFHTETAFRPDTPGALLIRCLRPDPEESVQTFLCDLRQAIAGIPDDSQALLREARFGFRLSDGDGPTKFTPPKAVIQSGTTLRYHFAEALMGDDEPSQLAVDCLARRIQECATKVHLKRGTMLVIDNYHMVHARERMAPGYDGRDRWLQRMLLR